MSDDIISSASTLIIYPTYTFIHELSTKTPSYNIMHLELFSSLSDLCLYISSIPSLTTDKRITKTRGAIAEKGFKVDIIGKHCKIAVARKYILAYR